MKKIIEITPGIMLIQFSALEELARTFLRFQEHYEGPKHRNKIFTIGEYRAWYAQEYGAFTYYTDWAGFNIPDTAIRAFQEGLFDPLTEEEQKLLDLVKDKTGKFYIIGVFRNEEVQHELAHGLYYIDSRYKKQVDNLLSNYAGLLDPLRALLLKDGYHEAVLNDEMHAYALADLQWLKNRGVTVPNQLHTDLQLAFDQATENIGTEGQ